MKTRKTVLAALAAGLFMGVASVASAALVWDMNTAYEFNGAYPDGPAPWGTITLSDAGPSLLLTIQSKLVPGSGNFYDKIGLSYSGAGTPLLAEVSRTGSFAVGFAGFGSVGFPAGETMNIIFNADNGSAGRFDGTDSIVYSINVPDLSSFTMVLPGNEFLVVAHLGGLGPNDQQSIGLTTVVPEPSTILAGALLALPFASALLRRRFFGK